LRKSFLLCVVLLSEFETYGYRGIVETIIQCSYRNSRIGRIIRIRLFYAIKHSMCKCGIQVPMVETETKTAGNNSGAGIDAGMDGMHIRLLIMTFFLQFFPDLVRAGHIYILQTPLFRVRNKQKTIYCYSEEERRNAVSQLGTKPEITRFKGLGEISPEEFAQFIGDDIRKDPVLLSQDAHIQKLLEYYMGKNTPDRQVFIIQNLKIEKDLAEELGVEVG